MKKIIYSFIALGALAISSCTSDPCKDKTAITLCSGNGTTVASGDNCTCNCNLGYSGTNCSVNILSKLINAAGYQCKDTATRTGQAYNYTSIISTSSVDPLKVIISNFGAFGTTTTLEAYLTSANTLETKTRQTIAGVAVEAGAKGVIASDFNSIRWTYSSTDATGTLVNTGSWTKK